MIVVHGILKGGIKMTAGMIRSTLPPRLTVNQIADFMGMSISWVYEQKYQGKLVARQPKKNYAVRVWREDFIRFLENEGFLEETN